jgi:hypothetical protein
VLEHGTGRLESLVGDRVAHSSRQERTFPGEVDLRSMVTVSGSILEASTHRGAGRFRDDRRGASK